MAVLTTAAAIVRLDNLPQGGRMDALSRKYIRRSNMGGLKIRTDFICFLSEMCTSCSYFSEPINQCLRLRKKLTAIYLEAF